MDDEREHAEVEQQVLAPPADEHDGVPDGLGRSGRYVFSAVNVMGREALEHGAGEGAVEPLGVGLDLGQLGHRYSPQLGEHAGGRRQSVEAAPHPEPAVDERLLADSSPAAIAVAVGRSSVMVTSGGG